MGLNWNKAFSNAFETGAALVGDSIRRDRDMANRSELMRMNDELDQQKAARANVAAVERHEAIRESDLKSADSIRSKKMSDISAIEERLRGEEAAANYRTKYNDPEVQAANIDAGARGILADSSPRGILSRRARAMQEYGDVEGAYKTMQIAGVDDKAAAANAKLENALQIAQMKGDFGMALGELKAASASGNEKATELMRNWKYLESQGYGKEEIASKLLGAKDTSFETVSEKGYEDGKEVTRTRKVAAGSANQYGKRPDGTEKESGFLGELKLRGGGIATEYSTQSNAVVKDGKMIDFPTLVPSLTKDEIELMTNDIIPNRKPIPEEIMQKAIIHAQTRINEGKSVFAGQTQRPPLSSFQK
jgi:hypothetical protein